MPRFIIYLLFFSFSLCTNTFDERSESLEAIKNYCQQYKTSDPHFDLNILEEFKLKVDDAAKGSFGKILTFDFRADPGKSEEKISVAVKKIKVPVYQFSYAVSEEVLQKRKLEVERRQERMIHELRISFEVAKQPDLLKTYMCFWSKSEYDSIDVFIVTEILNSETIDYKPKSINVPGISKVTIFNFVNLSPVQQLTVFVGLAKQMKLIHEVIGVTHNDIKPSNIMFTDSTGKSAKFIDYGGAAKIGDYVSSYTAPFTDSDTAATHKGDVQNDIWAFGISIAEILTQSSPAEFAFEDTIEFRYCFVSKKFERQKQIRDAVKAELVDNIPWASRFGQHSFANIFYKMTRVKRKDRIKTAQCVIEHLEALIAAFRLEAPSSKDVDNLFKNVCLAQKLVLI